jgi:hypothetical protein
MFAASCRELQAGSLSPATAVRHQTRPVFSRSRRINPIRFRSFRLERSRSTVRCIRRTQFEREQRASILRLHADSPRHFSRSNRRAGRNAARVRQFVPASGSNRAEEIPCCVVAARGRHRSDKIPARDRCGKDESCAARRVRVAAVSVGILDGNAIVDLNYEEDKLVTVDFNLAAT